MCNICVEKLSRVATVVFRSPTGAGILLVDERTCPAQVACDVGHKTSDVGQGPNITGQICSDITNAVLVEPSGAFYSTSKGNSSAGTDTTINGVLGVSMDASRSTSLYGSATTVQPPAIALLPCIKI